MSASDVESGLQAINRDIEGVKTAPTQMPGNLESVQLPCVLSYPGPMEPQPRSFSNTDGQREWIIRLYGAQVGSGRGYDEGYHDTLDFLSSFATEYKTQERTSNANWCGLDYLGDSGVVMMGLHGAVSEGIPMYWAIEFRVMIRTD